MKKIWQKNELKNNNISKIIEDFTVGDDYIIDLRLIPYDIQASKVHAKMLNKIKIINNEELKKLTSGLDEILELWENNKFIIKKQEEDCHTAIENFLTNQLGEIGKKIHTGRSRNDQVLVALRLYQKNLINKLYKDIKELISNFDNLSEKNKNTLMPGYTHMQRAMPSSVFMWADSYSSSFNDNLLLLENLKNIIDQNPLGSAAGFGEDILGIDREFTTKELFFKKAQKNPMYCAYSRGKFELFIIKNLSNFILDFGKFANDLLLFTTKEFNFFHLPTDFLTGSSIMPQKNNYDILEILRGKTAMFFGYEDQVRNIIRNLMSGYNRDFQLTKKIFFDSIDLFENCLKITNLIIKNLKINTANLKNACTKEIYATNEAYKLVKNGENFRDAYKKIGNQYL